MSAAIVRMRSVGVVVNIAPDDPDALDVDGPADVLAPWLTLLRSCKPGLLAALRSGDVPSAWARRASALLAGIEDAERRAELRDGFEERAAIVEYDGGLSREEAERLAFEELTAALGVTA